MAQTKSIGSDWTNSSVRLDARARSAARRASDRSSGSSGPLRIGSDRVKTFHEHVRVSEAAHDRYRSTDQLVTALPFPPIDLLCQSDQQAGPRRRVAGIDRLQRRLEHGEPRRIGDRHLVPPGLEATRHGNEQVPIGELERDRVRLAQGCLELGLPAIELRLRECGEEKSSLELVGRGLAIQQFQTLGQPIDGIDRRECADCLLSGAA